MIDTHTHLQFKAFEGKVDEIIEDAKNVGIEKIIVVGTNFETSKQAVLLSEKYEIIFASVGLHPHHVFNFSNISDLNQEISEIEKLILHPKVLAIGEAGFDKHNYENTKYKNYQITDQFLELQKLAFTKQIQLAIKYQKSLIIHNREAVSVLLQILKENWDPFLENHSVFHCAEPDLKLLDFAIKHHVFIGIDGDITYDKSKQEFVKKIPSELLVLETDSPYFIPEPLKSEGTTLNEPKNLERIADFIAQLTNKTSEFVRNTSRINSLKLFSMKK